MFAERSVRFSKACVTKMLIKSVPNGSRALTHVGHSLLLGLANIACYLIDRVFCITFVPETVGTCVTLFVARGARGFHKGRIY